MDNRGQRQTDSLDKKRQQRTKHRDETQKEATEYQAIPKDK